MVSSIVKKQIIAVVAVCCLLWSLFLIRFSTTIHYLNEESSTTTSSISILPINVTTHTTSNNNNNNNKNRNRNRNILINERSTSNGGIINRQSPLQVVSELKSSNYNKDDFDKNKNNNYDDDAKKKNIINDNDTTKKKKIVNVAYAISITSCPIIIENVTTTSNNSTPSTSTSTRRRFAPTVFDGPAVLSQSIREVHESSKAFYLNSTTNNNNDDDNEDDIYNSYDYDYDYTLYAFVLPSAAENGCGQALESLGYNVIVRDIPFDVNDIGGKYREKIETNGCCGSKEFMKLWSYSLVEHDIVVHVDTDVFFVKPLNVLFDAMMISSDSSSSEEDSLISTRDGDNNRYKINPQQEKEIKRQHHLLPPHITINTNRNNNDNTNNNNNERIDFFYTRDYLQENSNALLVMRDRERNKNNNNNQNAINSFSYTSSWLPVQGGFFIVRPNSRVLDDMVKTILKGEWNLGGPHAKKYSGFWGAYQIQGFLSYWYSDDNDNEQRKRNEQQQQQQNTVGSNNNNNTYDYHRSINAIELNPCIFNTMTHDRDDSEGREKDYYDFRRPKCKTTAMEQIYSVHLTQCLKPWACPHLKSGHPRRCINHHRNWFELRRSLEQEWNRAIPTDGWYFERTLGYCRRDDPPKRLPNITNIEKTPIKRYYVPLEMLN
jgi:hypothetical protein